MAVQPAVPGCLVGHFYLPCLRAGRLLAFCFQKGSATHDAGDQAKTPGRLHPGAGPGTLRLVCGRGAAFPERAAPAVRGIAGGCEAGLAGFFLSARPVIFTLPAPVAS